MMTNAIVDSIFLKAVEGFAHEKISAHVTFARSLQTLHALCSIWMRYLCN